MHNTIQVIDSFVDFIPASIYWKNRNGIYEGRNKYAMLKMQNLGLETNTTKDFVRGKSDFDLFNSKNAQEYSENDLIVLKHGEEVLKEETVILPNGVKIIQLSSKAPLFDSEGKICGLIGTTVDITDHKKNKDNQSFIINNFKKYGLSQRQGDCLYFLMKGMTYKQISKILHLSPRTVEHYIEAIKEKFNCHSRSELVIKAFHIIK